jgi:hypothetical protein
MRWGGWEGSGRTLEDGEGGDEGPFDIEVGVYLAVAGLQRRRRQEVRGAVPPDVRQALELVHDFRDGLFRLLA